MSLARKPKHQRPRAPKSRRWRRPKPMLLSRSPSRMLRNPWKRVHQRKALAKRRRQPLQQLLRRPRRPLMQLQLTMPPAPRQPASSRPRLSLACAQPRRPRSPQYSVVRWSRGCSARLHGWETAAAGSGFYLLLGPLMPWTPADQGIQVDEDHFLKIKVRIINKVQDDYGCIDCRSGPKDMIT